MRDKERVFADFTGFLVAFSVTLVLFSGILAGTLYFFGYTDTDSNDTSPVANLVEVPKTDNRLTMLISLRESEDYQPETYALIGFFPDEGQITVALLPPKTMFFYGNEWQTIERLYALGGMQYVAKGLSTYLELPIENTGIATSESLGEFMESAGYYEYYLGKSLDYPHNQRQVVLKQGSHLLDGRKTTDILFYPAYEGGEEERSDRGAMLITNMINHYISLALTQGSDDIAKAMLNSMDTDISYTDYTQRKEAVQFVANIDNPATAVYVEGELTANYEGFIITDDCIERIRKTYS